MLEYLLVYWYGWKRKRAPQTLLMCMARVLCHHTTGPAVITQHYGVSQVCGWDFMTMQYTPRCTGGVADGTQSTLWPPDREAAAASTGHWHWTAQRRMLKGVLLICRRNTVASCTRTFYVITNYTLHIGRVGKGVLEFKFLSEEMQ